MAFSFSKIKSVLRNDVAKPADRSVVGVDIGSSAIKVVQLRDKKGVPTLDTYGEMQLGPYGSVEIGRTVNLKPSKLTEAFVDIVRESSVTSREAALAIPYGASFATIVTVPTVDPEEIASRIPVEARKYIPVPLNEVTLDWFPVFTRTEKETTNVLLAAIHNDSLKRYSAMLEGAHFNQRISEIEIFSLIRSSVYQEDDTVAIIDFGAGSTKLYIARKGVVAKTHGLRMSGMEITNALSQVLAIDFQKAEELKRECGLSGTAEDPRIQKTITSVLERGFREIHTVLTRYIEEEGNEVQKVVLSGNGALLKGIDIYAKDLLSRPVVMANPFAKVAYPAFLEDTLKEAGPTFAVAVGAALRVLLSGDE